jgi:hypothetical protein
MSAPASNATLTRTSSIIASIAPWTHALLRIGIGLLYMQHGVQKLFGWFGGIDGAAAGNLWRAAACPWPAYATRRAGAGRGDARGVLSVPSVARGRAAAEWRRASPALHAGLPVLRRPRRGPGQPRRPQPAALIRHGRVPQRGLSKPFHSRRSASAIGAGTRTSP